MINIEQRNGSTVFTFSDNDRYLKNGEISVPVNSLSLSFDGSGFATFKKAATNDVFLEFFPENSNLATKENVINFYANNMVNIGSGSGSTGGGISDAPIDGKLYGRKNGAWDEVPSGITAGEVDSKIATAVADLATDADLQAVSGKVDENTAAIGGKQDTLVSGTNIKTVNGETLLGSGDITIQGGGVGQTYSGSTNGEIFNNYSNNVASGTYSHAEGNNTLASGNYSHAEGQSTSAVSVTSHAEGNSTIANGNRAHAEGMKTQALNVDTHAEGYYTIANNGREHAQGKYNKSNTGSTEADKTLHSIGIGTSEDDRKNAQEVMTNGDYYVLGVGGYDGKNYSEAQTVQEVISTLAEASGSTSGGGGITDAPSDGKLYGRKDASWTEVPSGITAGDVDSKIATAIASKQDTLVSGTNIKTVNGETLLGSGNISIQGGGGVGQNYQGSTNGEIFNDYSNNVASGEYSHAEGIGTSAFGANGSHAEGSNTVAQNEAEHAQGKYNLSNTGSIDADKTIHTIGIGTSFIDGKNAQEVMTNGDTYIYGVGGYDGTNYSDAQTVQEVISALTEASGSTSGGGITDAPSDDKLYGRKNGAWAEVPSGITAGDVDSKIATAVADLATDADLQAVSGKVDENTAAIGGKQDTLVSGTNIKTIGHSSILGMGNIPLCTINGESLIGIKDFSVGLGAKDVGGEIFNSYTGETKNAATGECAHAEGIATSAPSKAEHAEGMYNQTTFSTSLPQDACIHTVGIGTSEEDRKNAHEIKKNGDTYIYGIGGYNGKNYTEAQTLQEVISTLAEASGSTSSGGGGVGQTYSGSTNGEIFNDYTTNVASGPYSHAEGSGTTASGKYSHAEGLKTNASEESSHAEGYQTIASGMYSHAECYSARAYGRISHAEGYATNAHGEVSHAEGYMTTTNNEGEHAEGYCNKSHTGSTKADKTIHSIGIGDGYPDYKNAHEVMRNGDTYIYGIGGYDGTNYTAAQTVQEVISALTEASGSTSSGGGGVGKNYPDSTNGEIFNDYSNNVASGDYSHAEGSGTTASGTWGAHAEGNSTQALGNHGSHAEGYETVASGQASHAEGYESIAKGNYSHAEGSSSNANGAFAHAEGHGTIANNDSEHAEGSWNVSLTGESESAQTISTTGIGGADVNRKNARAIMKNGDCYVLGIGGYEGKDINSASSLQNVINGKLNYWKGSQSEYDELGNYDLTTLYIIADNDSLTKVNLGKFTIFGA